MSTIEITRSFTDTSLHYSDYSDEGSIADDIRPLISGPGVLLEKSGVSVIVAMNYDDIRRAWESQHELSSGTIVWKIAEGIDVFTRGEWTTKMRNCLVWSALD